MSQYGQLRGHDPVSIGQTVKMMVSSHIRHLVRFLALILVLVLLSYVLEVGLEEEEETSFQKDVITDDYQSMSGSSGRQLAIQMDSTDDHRPAQHVEELKEGSWIQRPPIPILEPESTDSEDSVQVNDSIWKVPESHTPGDESEFIDKDLAPVFHARKCGGYINYLDVPAPRYLPHYRNPCWVEELSTPEPYNDSFYLEHVNCQGYFPPLMKVWQQRYEQGQRWRLRCLPYFYLAGMPKCGTSDLYDRLTLHPLLTHGQMKEPHFWSRMRVTWGKIPISAYVDLFDGAAEQLRTNYTEQNGTIYHPMIFGDGSVTTISENDWWRELPENDDLDQDRPRYLVGHYLKQIQPDARFVLILRNPADRLYSDYMFFGKGSKSVEGFHEGVEQSIEVWRRCLQLKSFWDCVTDRELYKKMWVHVREGFYSFYLKEWMKIFPKENIFLLRLEDYKTDRVKHLNEIYNFLGLDPLPAHIAATLSESTISNQRHVETRKVGDMLNKTRRILSKFYKGYNDELAIITGDRKFAWPDV